MGHFAARALYSWVGGTAPMATRPSFVRTSENRVPWRTCPLPQAPDVVGRALRMPPSWAALSAADPPAPPFCGLGRVYGATTTVLHPDPTIVGAPCTLADGSADVLTGAGSALAPPLGVVRSPDSVTVVPAGGVNANCRASGCAKSTAVKATSNAGL